MTPYRITQDAQAYPILDGTCRGMRVRLEPFVDHLVWRKLPCLWIKVTTFQDNPYTAAFDLLVRPRGNECFSPAADLHHTIAMPPGWPADAMIRTDDPGGMPPLDVIEPFVRLFDDERMKELVTTPRGARLVMLIAEARRANYAVVRQIDLGGPRLAHADASRLLEAALSLANSLAASTTVRQAA